MIKKQTKKTPLLYDLKRIIRLTVSNTGRTCPKQSFKQNKEVTQCLINLCRSYFMSSNVIKLMLERTPTMSNQNNTV